MTKAAHHHTGTHHANSRKVREAATADPLAICWRDGLTLAQHPPHHDGAPATWIAGHTDNLTINGVKYWWTQHPTPWLHARRLPPSGSWLTPEASTCSTRSGPTRSRMLAANPRSRRWLA